jgi:hypothetical protein
MASVAWIAATDIIHSEVPYVRNREAGSSMVETSQAKQLSIVGVSELEVLLCGCFRIGVGERGATRTLS